MIFVCFVLLDCKYRKFSKQLVNNIRLLFCFMYQGILNFSRAAHMPVSLPFVHLLKMMFRVQQTIHIRDYWITFIFSSASFFLLYVRCHGVSREKKNRRSQEKNIFFSANDFHRICTGAFVTNIDKVHVDDLNRNIPGYINK